MEMGFVYNGGKGSYLALILKIPDADEDDDIKSRVDSRIIVPCISESPRRGYLSLLGRVNSSDEEDRNEKRSQISADGKKDRGKEDPFSNPSVQYVFGTGFRGGLVDSTNQQRADLQQLNNLPDKKSQTWTHVEGSSKREVLIFEDSKQGGPIRGFSEEQALISEDSKQGPPIPDPSKPGSNPENPNFFEVFVANSNCLCIPFEAAMHFIPDEHRKSKAQRTLHIIDHLNTQRDISYNWFEEENAFILTGKWSKYADEFKLCPMDKVRFTKSEQTLCFLTQIFRRPKDQPLEISLPKFLPITFILQIKLTPVDVLYGRLAISGERVRSEFPEIEEINGKYQMVKLTDCNDKNWFLKLVYVQIGDRYMMMDGWERLVKEHEVAAEDFISFYEPDTTSSNKHFQIQFEKKRRNDGECSGRSKDDVEGVAQESSDLSLWANRDKL